MARRFAGATWCAREPALSGSVPTPNAAGRDDRRTTEVIVFTPPRIACDRRLWQRGRAVRGVAALAAAGLLAVASAGAEMPRSGPAQLLPAALQSGDTPAAASLAAP